MPQLMPQYQGATLGDLTMPRRGPKLARNPGFDGGGFVNPGFQPLGPGFGHPSIGMIPHDFPPYGQMMPPQQPMLHAGPAGFQPAGGPPPLQPGTPWMQPNQKQMDVGWINNWRNQFQR